MSLSNFFLKIVPILTKSAMMGSQLWKCVTLNLKSKHLFSRITERMLRRKRKILQMSIVTVEVVERMQKITRSALDVFMFSTAVVIVKSLTGLSTKLIVRLVFVCPYVKVSTNLSLLTWILFP